VPPEQMSVEQATPDQTTRTTNELMHDAFDTWFKEEEGHKEEGVRRTGSAAVDQQHALSYF
jgi:hypothetical protein